MGNGELNVPGVPFCPKPRVSWDSGTTDFRYMVQQKNANVYALMYGHAFGM